MTKLNRQRRRHLSRQLRRRRTSARAPLPSIEVGHGPYIYLRSGRDRSVTFRFRTHAQAVAAQQKGMELDHVKKVDLDLVDAILRAAAGARPLTQTPGAAAASPDLP